jgi:hypothetical protein
MFRSLPLTLVLGFAAVALPAQAVTTEQFTVVETTGGKTTRATTTVTLQQSEGLSWETSVGKEGTNRVGTDAEGILRVLETTAPQGHCTLTSDGVTLKVAGTWAGKPLSGTLELKGRVWGLGFEPALKWYWRKGYAGSMPFLMVNPGDLAHPTPMVFTNDGSETVKGRQLTRLKVTLEGAMALFWGAKIWVDPTTGRMVRYQGTKGPGTPESVIEVEVPAI